MVDDHPEPIMIVSLKRFLESDLFKYAEIIAGQGGANNPVKAINIMDAPDGPMYMKEGTLCITTGYAWLEDPEVQKKLIENLKKQNVAGLGIMMRFFGGTLPETLQKTADALDMPIVSIDDHLVYTDIIMYFADHVYCQALGEFKEKRRLSEQLMSHIGDKSMRGLVCELNELLGKDIYINMDGKPVAYEDVAEFEKIRKSVAQWIELEEIPMQADCINQVKLYETDIDGVRRKWISCEFQADKQLNNVIYVKENQYEFNLNDYEIIEMGLRVVDLEFKKQAMNFEKNISELIDRLFEPGEIDFDVLRKDMEKMSFLVREEMSILLFPAHIKHDVLHMVNSILIKYYGSKLIMGNYGAYFIVFCPTVEGDGPRMRRMAEEICVGYMPAGKRYAAFGNLMPIANIELSFEQAQDVLYWGGMRKKREVLFYEDIGFLKLFPRSIGMEYIESYCKDHLAEIIEYDQKKEAELIKTLTSMVNNQWIDAAASQELFVHKNTIRYRMKQIKKLSSIDLDDAVYRFNMECAIRLHEFFSNE